MNDHDKEDTYLGDGLYASYDGWQVELYASNGRDKTNHVYLEPAVLAEFLDYLERLKAQRTAARATPKQAG